MVNGKQGPMTKSGNFHSKKRKSTKRARKSRSKAKRPQMIVSTERTIPVVSSDSSKNGMVIELDKLLSQVNSKLYRQGMNYHATVGLNSEGTDNNDTEFQVYVLPKDHRTIGAFRMARSIYNQAMQDELEIRPEIKSPWTDFKIDLYGPAQDVGADDMFINSAYAYAQSYNLGTFVTERVTRISDSYPTSEITSNAGDQKRFSLLDPTDSTHWNVFTEYTNFLLNRADPDSAVETPAYGDASPVLTEMAELSDKGDEPPYSWAWQLRSPIGATLAHKMNLVLAGTISAGPVTEQQLQQFVSLEAPLGLIFIKTSGNYIDQELPELSVKVRAGNYKGVKADRLYPKDKLLGF